MVASWRDGSTVRYVSTSCVLIALRGVFAFGEAEPSAGGLAFVVPSGTAEKAAPPAISARGPLGGLAWPALELPRMHLDVCRAAPLWCAALGIGQACGGAPIALARALGPIRAVLKIHRSCEIHDARRGLEEANKQEDCLLRNKKD